MSCSDVDLDLASAEMPGLILDNIITRRIVEIGLGVVM